MILILVLALSSCTPHLSLMENPQTEEVELVLLNKPEKEQVHKLPTPRREIYFVSAKIALFLLIAITYHTFCFVVHYHIIPIGTKSGVLVTPFFHCEQYHSSATSLSLRLTAWDSFPVSTVSVITTVNILIVSVALWPMKDVIDKIRVGVIIYPLFSLR